MIVCLGEGLVDLICERPVRLARRGRLVQAPLRRRARQRRGRGEPGGRRGLARRRGRGRRVGEVAARPARARGRRSALLRAARGRADADRLRQVRRATANPSFEIYGDAVEIAVAVDRRRTSTRRSPAPRRSSTARRRWRRRASATVTLRARELALERGARVCFDPNIRPNRWGGEVGAGGAGVARADRGLVPGAREPRGGDGDRRGRRSARSRGAELVELGAELAVVTLGPRAR